jgi:hypothetical protein
MLQMSIDPYDGSLSGFGQSSSITYHPNLVQGATNFGKLADLKQAGQLLTAALDRMTAISSGSAYRRVSSTKRSAHLASGRRIADRLSAWVSTTSQFGASGAFTNSAADTGQAIVELKAIAGSATRLASTMESDVRATRASSSNSNVSPPSLPGPEVPPMVTDAEEGMSTGAKFGLALLAVAVGYGVYKATEEEEGSPAMAGLRGAVYKGTPRKLVYTTKKRCLRWGRGPSGARRCRKYSKAARR